MQTRRLVVCSLVMILTLWSGLGWAQQPRHGATLRIQMYWVNVAGYPFFRAHTAKVPGFPFYGQAYLFLESTWLNK